MQQKIQQPTDDVSPQGVQQRESQPWHSLTRNAVASALNVEGRVGLSAQEARQRLIAHGPNQLPQLKKESLWEMLLEEVREPMILLLLVTGGLYALWGSLSDTLTIFAVILFVLGTEVFNERRAEHAIAGLSQLAEPMTMVRRDGQALSIPAHEVVVGDVLLLEAGRRLPADGRLIEAYGLSANESALTGESVPVDKDVEKTLAANTPLAERQTMAFAGTPIVRGRGLALVTATGIQTELGRIALAAREAKAPKTPLQIAMGQLSRLLVWIALAFSILVPVLAWLLSHLPLQQSILTGLSLAFATIPEEMPIIITMVLALGAYRLARQHAIVKRLQAVETLGSVTTIATDKTGTLTENRMRVEQIVPEPLTQKILELGVLCNDATGEETLVASDPLESALLQAAQQQGIDAIALHQKSPIVTEYTFESTRKLMSVVYQREGSLWSALKGAPEAIAARSSRIMSTDGEQREQSLTEEERERWRVRAQELAGAGLRVLAFAEKPLPSGTCTQEQAEEDLTFVGLVGLVDPPRPEAHAAMLACSTAGIRPLLITGDHPLTAQTIATQVGLEQPGRVVTGSELEALSDEALQTLVEDVSIYARTSPEQKLRIVKALQARGERVAVTGDGINDAPALSAADIGVAMGQKGTDVAREAADMVLTDDNFATIVRAIEEGRALFANLRKGVRYYLAVKVALVAVTLLSVLLRVPVPFAPVQILLMELFMDVAASVAFVSEAVEPGIMRQPPRDPRARFLDASMIWSIFGAAAGLFVAVSGVYLFTWYDGAGIATARTVAFVTWLLGHVLLAFHLRSERIPLVRLGVFSNRVMAWWASATALFVLLVTMVPPVQDLFKTTSLDGRSWTVACGAALLGTGWIEGVKWLARGRKRV